MPVQQKFDMPEPEKIKDENVAVLSDAEKELIALEEAITKGQGGETPSGSSNPANAGVDRLDPTEPFATEQEEILREQQENGATLTQRRADGVWVATAPDGTETEFELHERAGGLRA